MLQADAEPQLKEERAMGLALDRMISRQAGNLKSLCLGAMVVLSTGCESLREAGFAPIRRDVSTASRPIIADEDADSEGGGKETAEQEIKSVFKPNRLAGGLSSEAREIEKSLNAY